MVASLDAGGRRGHGLRTFLERVCDSFFALAALTIHGLARVRGVYDTISTESSALALGLSGLDAYSCFRGS